MTGPWSIAARDALRLTVDILTNAESQWEAGEDRRAALAKSGSTMSRMHADALPLSTLWRSEIARGHGQGP